MKIYAGIGSREIPLHYWDWFKELGEYFASIGWKLRSGHAKGSDQAFEMGCILNNGLKEIYLPWQGFNGAPTKEGYFNSVRLEAMRIASQYHPNWDRLNNTSMLLHGRNSHQILGQDLETSVDVVICWTPNGEMVGGTAQALRIAQDKGIPIFNAGKYKTLREAKQSLRTFLEENQLI